MGEERSEASGDGVSQGAGGNCVAMASVRSAVLKRPERVEYTTCLLLFNSYAAVVMKRSEPGISPNRRWEGEATKRTSRYAGGNEGAGFPGRVPGSANHLLGNGERESNVVHRIEPVAGGALLDPGSASRSGRALIP